MFLTKHPKRFFTPEEKERIAREIARAEESTSGEIRVHLDRHGGEDLLAKAKEIFSRLGMNRTRLRNGILIYLATDQRKFVILGDEGIHRVLSQGYWDGLRDEMQKYFQDGRFLEGLGFAVRRIGEELKVHFPAGSGGPNELPDEVSEKESSIDV